MIFHFFKEEALDYFLANVESNIDHYQEENNQWIYDQFKDPFIEIEIDCEPFELYVDPTTPTKMDAMNIKILYNALKKLTVSQACDQRLWTGLCHSDFYNYTRLRWSGNREKNNMKQEGTIKSRYFFSSDSKSKSRHTLAKLWWLGKLLYDDTNENDPLHFVDTLIRKDMATRINDIFTSNFSRTITILRPFLNVVDEYEKNGNLMNEDIFRSLVQYVNILGGIYVLDCLDETEIEKMLKERLDYYKLNGPDVVKTAKTKKITNLSQIRVYNKSRNDSYSIKVNETNLHLFLGKKIGDTVLYDEDELIIQIIY